MLEEISREPRSTAWIVRLISLVVALCSSTAAAVTRLDVVDRVDHVGDVAECLHDRCGVDLDRTEARADVLGGAGCLPGQVLDLAGDDGEALAASPARAASIVRVEREQVVCSAMARTTRAIVPISRELSPSRTTVALVEAATSAASEPTMDARARPPAISRMDDAISSVAAATDSTLVVTSSAAALTTAASAEVFSRCHAARPLTVLSPWDAGRNTLGVAADGGHELTQLQRRRVELGTHPAELVPGGHPGVRGQVPVAIRRRAARISWMEAVVPARSRRRGTEQQQGQRVVTSTRIDFDSNPRCVRREGGPVWGEARASSTSAAARGHARSP
jgi:hypothetical protein